MAPGCLADTDLSDLICTVDHAGVPLGRFPTTLEVEDRDDGLHWSLDLPETRSDVREAVERGDLKASSWRMIVGRDRWEGRTRVVEAVQSLRDVASSRRPPTRAPSPSCAVPPTVAQSSLQPQRQNPPPPPRRRRCRPK